MPRFSDLLKNRRVVAVLILSACVLAAILVLALGGRGREQESPTPSPVSSSGWSVAPATLGTMTSAASTGSVVESATIAATSSITPSATANATATTTAASTKKKPAATKSPMIGPTPANPTAKPDPTPVPGTTWPAKVAAFAKLFKKPVWYPSYTPKGYVLDSIDVVELDPGTGPVCSIVFTDKVHALQVTEGSPTNRTYPIVSLGKVAWGTAKADLMHQDPSDTTSPYMIVYSSGGNLAEVSGDAPTAELKAVAASMKLVTY